MPSRPDTTQPCRKHTSIPPHLRKRRLAYTWAKYSVFNLLASILPWQDSCNLRFQSHEFVVLPLLWANCEKQIYDKRSALPMLRHVLALASDRWYRTRTMNMFAPVAATIPTRMS